MRVRDRVGVGVGVRVRLGVARLVVGVVAAVHGGGLVARRVVAAHALGDHLVRVRVRVRVRIRVRVRARVRARGQG